MRISIRYWSESRMLHYLWCNDLIYGSFLYDFFPQTLYAVRVFGSLALCAWLTVLGQSSFHTKYGWQQNAINSITLQTLKLSFIVAIWFAQ